MRAQRAADETVGAGYDNHQSAINSGRTTFPPNPKTGTYHVFPSARPRIRTQNRDVPRFHRRPNKPYCR
jgi:hypothetical protein